MPADWNPGTQFVQGISIGGNLATAALGEGLRMQELKSQQALQQANERHIAAQTAALVQAQQMKIQEQADTAKAWTKINAETAPTLGFAPDASGEGMIPVPNPNRVPLTESLMRNLGPVVNAFHPDKMGAFVADVGSLQQRQAMAAQAGLPKPLTPEASAHLKAQTERENSQTDLNNQKIKDAQDFGPKLSDKGTLQKTLDAIELQRTSGVIDDTKAANARDVALGVRPRSSAAGDWLQKTEVSGFVKRREKLIESQIVEQQKLDTMQANPGHFSNTPTQISQQQRKVDFYQRQIDSVNAELKKHEPVTGSGAK
jgi:hypothetical protein